MVQYWPYHMKNQGRQIKVPCCAQYVSAACLSLAGLISQRENSASLPSAKAMSIQGNWRQWIGHILPWWSPGSMLRVVHESAATALARHKRTQLPQGLVGHRDKSTLQTQPSAYQTLSVVMTYYNPYLSSPARHLCLSYCVLGGCMKASLLYPHSVSLCLVCRPPHLGDRNPSSFPSQSHCDTAWPFLA